MSRRFRFALPALLVIPVLVAGMALSGGGGGDPATTGGAIASPVASAIVATPAPTPTRRPEIGGRELYGYLPWWRMSDTVANYVREVPLSTLALFSVSARRDGSLNPAPSGYQRINGPVGRRLIREAHDRGVRVELVFSSFGERRNHRLFRPVEPAPAPGPSGSPVPSGGDAEAPRPTWARTVGELVDLALELDVDGINVDVERLDEADRPGYGAFLAALRAALLAERPKARVTVATEAGPRGVGNAATAAAAGVDRVFLMGYEYHWSGSQPGASSPVDRTDGLYDLRWSIEEYVEAGVPRKLILLGLPLYGMAWRTSGPDRFAPVIGSGRSWILDDNADVLLDPDFAPVRDPIEHAEFFVEQDGEDWLHTWYDSPGTLRLKLALARDQGLAGGGFWAISYERGLPGYLELMVDFRDGEVARSEAPPPP